MGCCNNNSILNRMSSLIGSPACMPTCPPSGYGCSDIIFSDCVVYTGPTIACVSGNTGDTLTTIITQINAAICQVNGGDVPCINWNNINPSGTSGVQFSNDWTNASSDIGDIETGAYSDVFQCRVFLKGTVESPVVDPADGYTIFFLPAGSRPSKIRIFSAVVGLTGATGGIVDGTHFAAFILIYPTGEVVLQFTGRCCSELVITGSTIMTTTLEGISFDI